MWLIYRIMLDWKKPYISWAIFSLNRNRSAKESFYSLLGTKEMYCNQGVFKNWKEE